MNGKLVFSIIKFKVKDGIKKIDTIDSNFFLELKCVNSEEKQKEITNDVKKTLDYEIKEKNLKDCIKLRDKCLPFRKGWSWYHRMLSNIQIKKLVKKIEKFENKIKELEQEIINSNDIEEQTSLVLNTEENKN